MKKTLCYTALALVMAAVCLRADWVYNQNIVTNSPVTYSQSYTLNLNTTPFANGISRLAAQAVGSSSTLTTSTFTDGRTSTGSFTVASTSGLVATAATDSITVAPTAAILAASATDQLTVASTAGISGITVTFNGSVLKEGRDWFKANTTSGTAVSLATALDAFSNIAANASSSVIFATASVAGSAGNSFTLATSSPTNISTASFHFSGGQDDALANAFITFNGNRYAQGTSWLEGTTSSGTATNIAALLNVLSGLSASSAGSVVFATATVAGTASNSFTLSSSSSGFLTVGGPNFTGGVDNASVCINAICVTQGTDWTRVATTTGTAKAISDAIHGKASLAAIVTSTWTAASVVSATSTTVGTLSNYSLATSTPAAISRSGAFMTGGSNSAYTINTATINLPSHGLSTGFPVLFTSGTVTITPLVNQTTYFAIALDANDIELALTSTGAVAGTFITLTSSSTAGPHTFTLAPLAIAGTPSFKWQVSNDCSNYQDFTTTSDGVSVSSVTFASPYTPFVNNWDFGYVNYRCIRANVIAPSAGGLNLQITVNGKNL